MGVAIVLIDKTSLRVEPLPQCELRIRMGSIERGQSQKARIICVKHRAKRDPAGFLVAGGKGAHPDGE